MAARAGSEVEAANGALIHLGEPPIGDLAEQNPRARACNARFAAVRDALLREHNWNFATAWAVPAMDVTPNLGPLSKRYPMPPDCVAIRFVEDFLEDEWAVETGKATIAGADVEVLVLVTNRTVTRVCYTRIVETPRLWDALFLRAFEFRLAAAIAPVVSRRAGVGDELEVKADAIVDRAKRRDSQERARTVVSRDTSWISVRR